jgi:murein L,D-transpeptidase YcbB/YkuD
MHLSIDNGNCSKSKDRGSRARIAAAVVLFAAMQATAGSARGVAAEPAATTPVAAGPAAAEPATGEALKKLVAEGNPIDPDWTSSLIERERIGKLYANVGYRLLWSDAGKPTTAAIGLIQELRGAADRGLDPNDYPGNQLAARADALRAAARLDEGQCALFDASLSLAAIRFLSDLHYGRVDPATVGNNLTVERVQLDLPAALAHLTTAVNLAAAIDALEPQFIHYALLKRELARYRQLAAQPAIEPMPPLPARSLKPGAVYAGAAQLERLLLALGDMGGGAAAASGAPPAAAAPAAPATALTPPLVAALERFQERHGLKPDGILGGATFAQLGKPLPARVRQIELTMERWRWLPSEFVSAPIIVNIPEFRLFAFESTTDSEARIRQMEVIVGKAFEAAQTPVFSADMTYLIFRPYWDIPYSIAVKEIVPAARRSPAYLNLHHMEIVRGNGETAAAIMPNTAANLELLAKGVLRVRQKPGPDNSLGLVKFMLPNPYNVYLHSTPAKELFSRTRRAFSHGCVRVSDPAGLAEYVLRASPEWTREKIVAAMNDADTQTVTLKNRIRVFFLYGTALAIEDGRVFFFEDIYGHDHRLEAALDSRRPRIALPAAAHGAYP